MMYAGKNAQRPGCTGYIGCAGRNYKSQGRRNFLNQCCTGSIRFPLAEILKVKAVLVTWDVCMMYAGTNV
jgi:hypothetical protein